jgi:hypothetical protein
LALLLAAHLASAACNCALPNLAAERTALPAVYDQVFGLVPPHVPAYWQARLTKLAATPAEQWTLEQHLSAAVAEIQLGRERQAAARLRAQLDAGRLTPELEVTLARALCRLSHWSEAVPLLQHAVETTATPPARWRWQLLAAQHGYAFDAITLKSWHGGMCGFELSDRLGDNFRQAAPKPADDAAFRAEYEAGLWLKLGLPGDAFNGELGVFDLTRRDAPEGYFMLAELLAGAGYRRLAWHAYQRAWDLEHPRSIDIPTWQAAVAEPLGEADKYDLSPPRHYVIRRAVVNWVAEWRKWEAKTLAAGGDPDDPMTAAAFYQEHPRP